MIVNDEAYRAAQTIQTYAGDIEETKKHIKTQTELADHIVENMTVYSEIIELEKQLEAKKLKLKQDLARNSNYNDYLEEIGQSKETLKSQKQILSDHIVAYYGLTQERQLEIGEEGEAINLILTGKLGKTEKYQTSIFSQGE